MLQAALNYILCLYYLFLGTSKPVVNITVPICYKGKHYPGVTLHNGVNIAPLQPAPCDPLRRVVCLKNGSPNIKPFFYDGLTNIEDNTCYPTFGYLQIRKA